MALHPEAAAFAGHYGFAVDVLAAYRPTGKGRVERQVAIVRDHVLAGRVFVSLAELDGAFNQWVPIRRGQVHRTHGELIGARAAADHAALGPLPALPYLVWDRHLRRVGRDCLISFAGSHYSVPARAADGRPARAGQRVEVRVSAGMVTIHRLALDGDPIVLASHLRAGRRGSQVVDPAHWDGLPDGHTRAVTPRPGHPRPTRPGRTRRARPARRAAGQPAGRRNPGRAPAAGCLRHRRRAHRPADRPMSELRTRHPDQAEQIRRLLGTVEDWLLHTSFEVLDDLGAFLAGLSWSTAPPERLVAWMIAELGEQTVALRHATTDDRTAEGMQPA